MSKTTHIQLVKGLFEKGQPQGLLCIFEFEMAPSMAAGDSVAFELELVQT